MTTSKTEIKKTSRLLLIMFGLIYFSGLMTNNLSAQSQNSSEWKLYSEVNGIHIYSKQIECNDEANGLFQEAVILKFVNTTNEDFTIEWDYELWYDNKCWTCDNESSKENSKTINLKAQQVMVGDCENNETLWIFRQYTNHDDTAVLTKFELKNLTTIIK